MKNFLARLRNSFKLPSFRFKLMLSHMSISLAIILIFGSISILYTYYIVRGNEEKTLERLVAVVDQDISSRLKAYNNIGLNLVINDIIKQNLNKMQTEQYISAQNIRSVLRPVRISDSNISNIMILDFQGNVYSTDITLMLPADVALKDTSVYRQAAAGNGALVWLTENDIFDSYSPSDIMYQSRTNIHAAAVIRDYNTNQDLGIAILSLRKNFFTNITYSDEELQNTGFYLVSPDKKVIYPVSNSNIDLPKKTLDDLNFTNIGSFSTKSGYAVDYQHNNATNWYMVSITDNKTLYGITYKLIWVLLVGIGVCIFMSIVISRTFSRILYGGIADIKKGMLEVERGNLNVVIHTNRSDEFGHLIERFNQMVRQIRELIVAKYQQELARQKAEFHALQMQINPHFLYNTFDMLHWKLIGYDHEELSESVVAISKLLRYSISNSENNVTLEQELENVNDYLKVLSSINDKNIEYTLHTVDEQKILLPRLTIQPLVENSVLHGFESRKNGNRLAINGFYLESDIYCIDIIDNGLGIQPLALEELNNAEQKEENTSKHVGVKNVRLRIQYLYGNTARVIVSSQYGNGTHIRIQLPLRKGTDKDEDCSNR